MGATFEDEKKVHDSVNNDRNNKNNILSPSPLLLFISAETQLSSSSIQKICNHVDSSTLVVGAKLQGHDHHTMKDGEIGGKIVELNGRTTPWNTAAVWNLRKLSLVGFPLVAEGLVPNYDGSPGEGGVE